MTRIDTPEPINRKGFHKPSNPVTLADTGYRPEILYSTVLNVNMKPSGQGGAKRSKGSRRKIGQNRVGHSVSASSKYEASGGMLRQQARKARNMRRQAKLAARGAERRIEQASRRYDRRILKAAEQLLERIDG